MYLTCQIELYGIIQLSIFLCFVPLFIWKRYVTNNILFFHQYAKQLLNKISALGI